MSDPDPTEVVVQRGELTVTLTEGRDEPEPAIDADRICALALAVLEGEGVAAGRLDVHIVDRDDMADLNAEHLGVEGPTDVLSFPLDPAGDGLVLDGVIPLLGDLVLCPAVAAGQAASHAGTFAGEMALLVVHGVLHILGHDHAEVDEAAAMRRREAVHLESFGHVHPGPQ
jgi:probable rRNA maturation factor